MRAWIEIDTLNIIGDILPVALFMRAWIEIRSFSITIATIRMSPSS